MWNVVREWIAEGRVQRFSLRGDSGALSYANVLDLLGGDANFRRFFIDLLANSSFPAFRWETPAVTRKSVDNDFEFVLLRSTSLDRPVDVEAFALHFATGNAVATFENIGGDAKLVVPCPLAEVGVYVHLATFVRGAPESQVHALWQAVAAAMQHRITDRPVWLSTAGMGVSWLHVRLDDRRKYYGYAPYLEML